MEKLQPPIYEKQDGSLSEPITQPDMLSSTSALFESWTAQPEIVAFGEVNAALAQLEEFHPDEAALMRNQMYRILENIG